jgi:hypothetical protein
MAWHISFFLKYLDSLEDFRKKPHDKIPSKSPCTNFQSLLKSKFQIKFEKVLFLELGSASVFSQAAAHFLFSTGSLSFSPLGLGGALPAYHLLSGEAPDLAPSSPLSVTG